MPKFSFYPIPFKNEPLETSLARLAKLGYDSVELPGDLRMVDVGDIQSMLSHYGLTVSAVCPRLYVSDRDLTAADSTKRGTARDYFVSLVELAVALGAGVVIVSPTVVRRVLPETTREQEWTWAVEGIRAIAEAALATRVELAIEPWNRYETYLVNRLEDAERLRVDVGMRNVGVMGDTFHMNIEESDIAAAFLDNGKRLLNIHCADSNRQAPGRGHIDFVPIMRALQGIGYSGPISVEYVPPKYIFETVVPAEYYDVYPGETILQLREAWTVAIGGSK